LRLIDDMLCFPNALFNVRILPYEFVEIIEIVD